VKRESDHVRDKDKHDAHRPAGEAAPQEAVPEPVPIATHEGNFGRASPPGFSKGGCILPHQMNPGEEVQVEPRNRHDGVVVVLLNRNQDICSFIPEEDEASVVGGFDGAEEGWGCGEQRSILDIGVMFLLFQMVC